MDDIDELPKLEQVGTTLLPQFFHLAVGTSDMWDEGWPQDDGFALFLNFHVFEGRLTLAEIQSAGLDVHVAYERFRKVVPIKQWKSLGVRLMVDYLARFIEEGGRPDEDSLPAHGPRAVASYETKPSAAMVWLEQLEKYTANAYATARDVAPPKQKRRRITDDFLREVAEAYEAAESLGLPPTREVANRFDAPHSTVSKWVASARRKGFLPPAEAASNDAARAAVRQGAEV
ncbi:hypothetical protein [Streptomyces griseus]|uniref:hypothetical protein n=1 Tax=Streptomyces griseus TaxID=1911 RepID=UPI0033B772F5